jgi:hypothetical protein
MNVKADLTPVIKLGTAVSTTIVLSLGFRTASKTLRLAMKRPATTAVLRRPMLLVLFFWAALAQARVEHLPIKAGVFLSQAAI